MSTKFKIHLRSSSGFYNQNKHDIQQPKTPKKTTKTIFLAANGLHVARTSKGRHDVVLTSCTKMTANYFPVFTVSWDLNLNFHYFSNIPSTKKHSTNSLIHPKIPKHMSSQCYIYDFFIRNSLQQTSRSEFKKLPNGV